VHYLEKEGIVSDPPNEGQQKIISDMIPLVQERLKLLSDISEMTRFLFQEIDTPPAEELVPKKLDSAKTLEQMNEKSDEQLEDEFRMAAEQLDVKFGAMLSPIRAAVTGSTVSPPLFGSLRLLGQDKSLDRIDRAIQQITQEVA
jgi:glutamyl-tRNA synthetase